MKSRTLSVLLAFAATAFLSADTITLKDGTKLEGKVVSETDEAYTVMVQVTASIKDERTIKKEDVASIDKSGPDDIAFKEIQKLLPAPDRLTKEQYADRIGRIKAFLNVYPTSSHAAGAKTMITKLEAERNLAAKGGLKLDGRWISAADRAANAYEIDARLQINDMEDAAKAQRYQAALKHFDVIEAEFAASEQFEKARELALQVLTSYKPVVADLSARVDQRTKDRAMGLQRLAASDRAAEEAAIAQKTAAFEKRNAKEKAARAKWLTLDPFHKASADTVLRTIDATRQNLERTSTTERKKAGPVYRQAWAAALAGNLDEGKTFLSELKGMNVPARYIEVLEAKLAPPEEPDTPDTPAPATDPDPEPEPEPAPEPDPKEDPKTSDKPAPGGEDKPDAGDSGDESSSETSEPGEEAEKKGISVQFILLVVMAVVIIGALAAAFGGKKK